MSRLAGSVGLVSRLAGSVGLVSRLAGSEGLMSRLAGSVGLVSRLAGSEGLMSRLAGSVGLVSRLAGSVHPIYRMWSSQTRPSNSLQVNCMSRSLSFSGHTQYGLTNYDMTVSGISCFICSSHLRVGHAPHYEQDNGRPCLLRGSPHGLRPSSFASSLSLLGDPVPSLPNTNTIDTPSQHVQYNTSHHHHTLLHQHHHTVQHITPSPHTVQHITPSPHTATPTPPGFF